MLLLYDASMTETELLTALSRGEHSQQKFKRDVPHADALSAELIAFANSAGGVLFIGVEDDGRISGLARQDVSRLV